MCLFMIGCSSSVESERLDEIEEVMNISLDSAATMLNKMPKPTASEENIARYNLIDNWL